MLPRGLQQNKTLISLNVIVISYSFKKKKRRSGCRGTSPEGNGDEMFYMFALTDKRAATVGEADLNGRRCLPEGPEGSALLSDLAAASPGGLVNRPHLITYRVSFASHV